MVVLPRGQRLALADIQADHVEAEAGIDRIGERIHPLAEQADQQGGIARRLAGRHLDARDRAVAAEEARDEKAAAFMPFEQGTRRLRTQFLQAGAARVLVPVHPGYNDAVMYFLENNGAIWNGGEPPRLNDPMFISLADELREITDDLQNATADGDPWQVILPTTLVYLQKDASLPTFP